MEIRIREYANSDKEAHAFYEKLGYDDRLVALIKSKKAKYIS